eukprot:SAG31_NODE_18716_length_625_cov_1.258555_1_plen_60_part_10
MVGIIKYFPVRLLTALSSTYMYIRVGRLRQRLTSTQGPSNNCSDPLSLLLPTRDASLSSP